MGCITSFGRVVLILLNLVFLLVSLALTAIGVVLKFFSGRVLGRLLGAVSDSLDSNTRAQFHIPDFGQVDEVPLLGELGLALIVLGALLFLAAFCACCGACCQFRPLLAVFVVLMCIMVIVQGTVGGLFLAKDSILHEQIRQKGGEKINSDYNPSGADAFSFGINILNYLLQCCGVNGQGDFAAGQLAASCCKRSIIDANDVSKLASCTAGTSAADLNTEGCYSKLVDKVQDQLVIGAVILALILFLEVLEIVFAILIIKDAGKVGVV